MKLEITCLCGNKEFKEIGEYKSRKEIERIYECLKCRKETYVKIRK